MLSEPLLADRYPVCATEMPRSSAADASMAAFREPGVDFIIARDGKMAALYVFLDSPPA